jgi:hypothetical protein
MQQQMSAEGGDKQFFRMLFIAVFGVVRECNFGTLFGYETTI